MITSTHHKSSTASALSRSTPEHLYHSKSVPLLLKSRVSGLKPGLATQLFFAESDSGLRGLPYYPLQKESKGGRTN